jgi:hypothetical protein
MNNLKLTYHDLNSLSLYYLLEFSEKYKVPRDALEELYLEALNIDVFSVLDKYYAGSLESERDEIRTDSYEQGRDEGYDSGYEDGYNKSVSEHKNSEFIKKTVADANEKEAWKDGYKTGYKDGIDWKNPKVEKKELTDYAK